MFKKALALLLIAMMVLSLVACTKPAEQAAGKIKIGILTGTVSQNEEEYRAAENAQKKYGADRVIIKTYPDKFMDEQDTTISLIVEMASDPEVKALVLVQAVPGVSAGIEKALEIRKDLLIIAGVPGEDPAMIASKADIVFALDELAMGKSIPEQAQAMGAKTFVHYSFPRHMSYALLAARRDLFKENCVRIGLEFVDATAPDPTGDAGVPGAQQFILEDVPRMVAKYGKDTAFFSTNCAMQVPLIKAALDEGAMYPQPCCPSPTHGFPSALGLSIPEDKTGDYQFILEEITKKVAEKGGTGKFSTWSVPISMMFMEAGVDYAVLWAEGKTNGKLDMAVLKKTFSEYAKTDIQVDTLTDNGVAYPNYLMILLDFYTF
jgi:hypothetical protein